MGGRLRGVAKQATLPLLFPFRLGRRQRDTNRLRGVAKQAVLSLVFLLKLGQMQRDTTMFQDIHRKVLCSSLLGWEIKTRIRHSPCTRRSWRSLNATRNRMRECSKN